MERSEPGLFHLLDTLEKRNRVDRLKISLGTSKDRS